MPKIKCPYTEDDIRELLEKGYTSKEIAEKYDRKPNTIRTYISYHHLRPKKEEKPKKRITVNTGDRLKYQGKTLRVIDVNKNMMVCQHEEGYKETFTIADAIILFTTKRMSIE